MKVARPSGGMLSWLASPAVAVLPAGGGGLGSLQGLVADVDLAADMAVAAAAAGGHMGLLDRLLAVTAAAPPPPPQATWLAAHFWQDAAAAVMYSRCRLQQRQQRYSALWAGGWAGRLGGAAAAAAAGAAGSSPEEDEDAAGWGVEEQERWVAHKQAVDAAAACGDEAALGYLLDERGLKPWDDTAHTAARGARFTSCSCCGSAVSAAVEPGLRGGRKFGVDPAALALLHLRLGAELDVGAVAAGGSLKALAWVADQRVGVPIRGLLAERTLLKALRSGNLAAATYLFTSDLASMLSGSSDITATRRFSTAKHWLALFRQHEEQELQQQQQEARMGRPEKARVVAWPELPERQWRLLLRSVARRRISRINWRRFSQPQWEWLTAAYLAAPLVQEYRPAAAAAAAATAVAAADGAAAVVVMVVLVLVAKQRRQEDGAAEDEYEAGGKGAAVGSGVGVSVCC
ncbi:hypothetical protein HYH02_012400 [Chlamydomonas schloesseri]|uniref:Uncharacterized protein n=1 Tax=Chlamydomonas schloesseri TaxID=2026947 RepID=A0A835SZM8_9CHLO|nr:hypothetical protein HYH02_012400 [Chlamydomonas schloesseri]|eukprot:KAG2434387.1 hypothetical protein HYH02_012400 [Chlamydomonas schloesseri]